MQPACLRHVVGEESLGEPHHFHRRDVRCHRHYAAGARCHEREGLVIVAAEDAEALGCAGDDFGDLRVFARSFLDCNDVLDVAGQPQGGGGLHVTAGAAGHVVNHYRLRGGRGHGFKVLILTLLRGLVVVGHHNQEGIGTVRLELAHAFDRGLERIGAAAHHHRTALGAGFRDLEDFNPFLDAQAGSFAGRPERDEEVDAGFDLPVHACCESIVVDAAVFLERGEQRGAAPFER